MKPAWLAPVTINTKCFIWLWQFITNIHYIGIPLPISHPKMLSMTSAFPPLSLPVRREDDGTFTLHFFWNDPPQVPFWLRVHPRAWLILNRKLQGRFIKLINIRWGPLHESLRLTCLEQKSLCQVLWLTCFVLNRFLSAAVRKLKINHLKLSIWFKKCLSEVDTLLLYTRLIFLWKKKSGSITDKAEFLHLILHCHMYIWSYINKIATLLLIAELWHEE